MVPDNEQATPTSPEEQEEYVREELDQEYITHQGDYRKAPTGPLTPEMRRRKHLGATEDENVPVLPPMSGPADLVGEEDENAQGNEVPRSEGKTKTGEEAVDPRDELTPG